MYICLCNALNEREMHDAVSACAGSVANVYKYHDCAPRCGRCVPVVRDMVQGSRSLPTAEPQPLSAAS